MNPRKTVLERFAEKLAERQGGVPATQVETALCEAIDDAILDAIARLVPVESAPSVKEDA